MLLASNAGWQVGVIVAWGLLIILIAYMILNVEPAVGAILATVLAGLVALFIPFAAGVMGVDLEQVKDLVDALTPSDGGGTDTGTTTNG